MASDPELQKPRVLILGGCGFIGRNFVQYLISNELVSYIKVADKALPGTSYLSPEAKAAFDNPKVKFQQADLSRDAHIQKVFEDRNFDFVFNLCGETRCGMRDEEYEKKIVEPAIKAGNAAKAMGVKKFVEVSTAQVYDGDKHAHTEDAKTNPWTVQATFRLKAEEELKKMGLPLVILRPAFVYGSGDLTTLSPRLSSAAVYQHLKKKMKLLWDKDLKINVVHVDDVAAALWIAATELPPGSLFNLADQSNLTQGDLNAILETMFGIETGFLGSILSNLAKLNLEGVANSANDEHVPAWTHLCAAHGIQNTPISPYVDKEMMKNNNLFVDGTAISRKSTFKYKHPKVTVDLVRAQADRKSVV